MGAGASASASGPVDKALGRELAGDLWDEDKFDLAAEEDGRVSVESWNKAVADNHAADTPPAPSAAAAAVEEDNAEVASAAVSSPLLVEIPLTDLQKAVEAAWEAGKTPLVVDRSKDDSVNTFYSYQHVQVVEAKKMGLDKSMKQIPVPEIMEGARKELVSALKHGKTLLIRLATSVTDFKGTFNDGSAEGLDTADGKAYFPIEIFEAGGAKINQNREWQERLWRDDEKEQGHCVQRGDMKVVVTSQFDKEDFAEFLWPEAGDYGLPPRELFQEIWIVHDEDTEMMA